jgi:hypothetical protein
LMVSMWKKSQARMACAWARRNSVQDGPARRVEQPRVFRTGFLLVLCYFLAVQPSVVNFLRRAIPEP